MTRQKKLSNKTGDFVEIKEEGKDVTAYSSIYYEGRANGVSDGRQL